MDRQDLLKGELIGKYAVVIESKNKPNKGQKGKIIDETKNLFTIEDESGKKRKFVKSQCLFGFCDPNEKITIKIDGNLLVGRPEDRIKSKVKHEKRK